MTALPITVFSDFTCPFCYVTEVALRALRTARELAVAYRAVELCPVPRPLALPLAEAGWEQRVLPVAAELSLPVAAPPFRARTRKAHEASRAARGEGMEPQFRDAVFGAYWSGGRDIGRVDVLSEIAGEVGMDPVQFRIVLDIDRYADEVQRDAALALRLGIETLPTIFIGSGRDATVMVGGQDAAALAAAIADR